MSKPSDLSKWYHSINFIRDEDTSFNTWEDFHMVPMTRPVINPPEVVRNYVEIAGADGTLDYTEVLAGRPIFRDRTGSWEFVILNGYQEWITLYNYLLENIHGSRFDISLDDEPGFVYNGRLTVNEWKSEEHNSKIVIDYTISPFKKRKNMYVDDWLWNDLTFDNDSYTIYYGTFNVSNKTTRNIYNPSDNEVPLYITSSGNMNLFWYGTSVDVSSGSEVSTGIILEPGDNLITFTGNGAVTILYDKGARL